MIFGNKLFDGCKLIEQKIFFDKRGYFTETYNKKRYQDIIGDINFVQDNESLSNKFVIRGLHFQKNEFAQAKLIRVVNGSIIDFILDIRPNSSTFGKMLYIYLKPELEFFIPRGIAHGFIALEDTTIFSYKCDNYYNKDAEGGYNILDEKLGIIEHLKNTIPFEYKGNKISLELLFEKKDLIFSEKDLKYPNFSDTIKQIKNGE